MIEFNSEKLRQPLYAGIAGGSLIVIFIFLSRKWKEQQNQPVNAALAKDLYYKPAIIVGLITTLVMHLSRGPEAKSLSEPFE